MAFDSFREFLKRLEAAGELRRIAQPVATELEITEIADREMKKPGGGQALLLENPTVNGQISPFPLAINALGSHRRMAMSLGANSIDELSTDLGSLVNAKPPTSFKEAIKLLGTAIDLRHAKPKVMKDGPCKEVVHKFEAPATRTEPWPKAPDILIAGQASRLSPGILQWVRQAGRLSYFAEPAHPTMLAPGRGPLHHFALRGDERPRYRPAQRRHVSYAGL